MHGEQTIITGYEETLRIPQGFYGFFKFSTAGKLNCPLATKRGERHLDELKLYLSMTNLYDLFAPHIFSVEVVSNGKPPPDVFLYAADHMKTPSAQCIVIDDSVSGVVAGNAVSLEAASTSIASLF